MSEVSIKDAFQQALTLQQEGRIEEALGIFEQILKALPNDPSVLFFTGTARQLAGNSAEAVDLLKQAATVSPDNPDIWNHLGVALFDLERFEEAEFAYRKATELNPSHADAWNNLGNILNTQSRFEEAEDAFRHSLMVKPDHLKAKRGLALILMFLKRYQEAEIALTDLLEMRPEDPEFLEMIGGVLIALSRPAEAEGYLLRSIAISQDQAVLYNDLGNCLTKMHRYSEAESAYRKAIDLESDDARMHSNLAALLKTTGQVNKSIKMFRHALELENNNPITFSNLIFALIHDPDTSGEAVLEECQKWTSLNQSTPSTGDVSHDNSLSPNRRLKIGYVSPDFRRHAVAYFLEPLLASHDHDHFEIYAYAEITQGDEVTERFQLYTDHWCNTVGMDDESLAAQIRKDGIDILVDCGGYTTGSRLMMFALKPAPIQVATLLGHGMTTGLAAMDYMLVDSVIAPNGAEAFFSEELLRLPHGVVSFRPDPTWPEIGPRKRNNDEEIVFAYFNGPDRINSLMIDIWGQILQALPKARLLLKHHAYDEENNKSYWRELFADLPSDRIDFEGLPGGWPKNMDVYERVDIILDSFPVTGSTTIVIPLWMGTPVISLGGSHSGQRLGVAFLCAAGLPELAADSPESYVEKAICLAQDRDRLALLRKSLRDKIMASSLCNDKEVTRSIEVAYREMWKKWCAAQT